MNDEAGSLCIHFVAGVTAFIGTEMISERMGRFQQDSINRSVDNQQYKQQKKIERISSSFALAFS